MSSVWAGCSVVLIPSGNTTCFDFDNDKDGDGGDDGGVDGVGRHLDGPRELDVETLGDRGGDHAGHGDGLGAGVEDEQLQGLGAGVRGHEAEVHHLLRAVDPGLRGHLHLQRQVEELSTGRVGLDPENIKCFINI